MPTYSFVCQKCQNNFLVQATFAEFDKKDSKKFSCPKCGSKKIKQNFSEIFILKEKTNNSKNNFSCRCGSCQG